MSKNLQETTLLELIPASISNDKQAVAMSESVQPHLDDICVSIPFIELYRRVDELPEPILHLLAWENNMAGVEWRLAKTIEDKRNLVKNSFELNKRRGTRWAVERVFSLLRLNARIVEWFEEGAQPFTFRIAVSDIGGRGIAYDEIELLDQLVDIYKPLTRHGTTVDLGLSPDITDIRTPVAVTFVAVIEVGL